MGELLKKLKDIIKGNRVLSEKQPIAILCWVCLFAGFLYFAFVPIDVLAQMWLSGILLLCMLVLRKLDHRGFAKNLFLLIAAFLTLRYFFWRTYFTLSYYDFFSFIGALALYSAEVYGITIHLVSIFVNINPLDREPVPLSSDPQTWPSVDIMIPSYNEDPEILEVTLLAATQVRYSKEKFKIYLLDDGGTLQKRNDPDPEKAARAEQRREILRELCARVGAHYLTRERNLHAKAGNINAALEQTDGDLVLILDADHVPTADILEKTVGWFERDPKLFLVQTPHFFINPDPVERNLETFKRMPSENEMFYRVIQRGLDFWGASFFCGSAALLRRKYLLEIGGISGESITEDAETALELHSRGYRSAYIRYPLIAGLQPETFSGFVVQRTRWAQGMVQIFLLKNPLLKKGLSFAQRLSYFNSSFFWFFSYARVIFLLAPAAYLLFGLRIYNTDFTRFLGYAVPHLIASFLAQDYLFSRVRWVIVSELYELLQAVFALPGIIKVFLNPRSPAFGVTPKGEHLTEDFISPLAFRFYCLFLLNVVCLATGFIRYNQLPEEHGAVIITSGWAVFNIILTWASLGVLLERKQRRSSPRVPAAIMAEIAGAEQPVPCYVRDISVGGANLVVPKRYATVLESFTLGTLRIWAASMDTDCEIGFAVRQKKQIGAELDLGVQFRLQESGLPPCIVELVHGHSERWTQFLEERANAIGMHKGFLFFVYVGSVHAVQHLILLIRSIGRSITGFTRQTAQRSLVSAAWRIKTFFLPSPVQSPEVVASKAVPTAVDNRIR